MRWRRWCVVPRSSGSLPTRPSPRAGPFLAMSIAAFLVALFDHGRVAVPEPAGDEPEEELAAATARLDAFEADWRLDFPGEAPRWDRRAGLYGARLLYRGAQGAVFRAIDADAIRDGLSLPEPEEADGPAAHYAVDLALRFLPDLTRLTRGASEDDPLLSALGRLGCRWPLSSVGMPGVTPTAIEAIIAHPGLLRLYVDRILAADDPGRLGDPRVADAVRRAVGLHDGLAPPRVRAFLRGDP